MTRTMYQTKRRARHLLNQIHKLERVLGVCMPHTCHAKGCNTQCKPEYLMCPHHWHMVPGAIQREVYKHYRPGQCTGDPAPSPEWHEAADKAIKAVQMKEGQ